MNIVMTLKRPEDTYIQFRIHPDFKREVEITAYARNLTVSSLIKSLLRKAVREERNEYPQLFADVVDKKSNVKPTHSNTRKMERNSERPSVDEKKRKTNQL